MSQKSCLDAGALSNPGSWGQLPTSAGRACPCPGPLPSPRRGRLSGLRATASSSQGGCPAVQVSLPPPPRLASMVLRPRAAHLPWWAGTEGAFAETEWMTPHGVARFTQSQSVQRCPAQPLGTLNLFGGSQMVSGELESGGCTSS